MRAVADFDPEWSGSYFVPGHRRPPVALLVQVWPQLDNWKRPTVAFLRSRGGTEHGRRRLLGTRGVASRGLLQDAVFLRESYPDHPIFQDRVFSCPEFEASSAKFKTHAHGPRRQSYHVIQKSDAGGAEKLRISTDSTRRSRAVAERRHLDLWGFLRTMHKVGWSLRRRPYTVTFKPWPKCCRSTFGGRRSSQESAAPTRDGPQVHDTP